MNNEQFENLVLLIETIADEVYWSNVNSDMCDNRRSQIIDKVKSVIVEEDVLFEDTKVNYE